MDKHFTFPEIKPLALRAVECRHDKNVNLQIKVKDEL